jgi:hypothetical protein
MRAQHRHVAVFLAAIAVAAVYSHGAARASQDPALDEVIQKIADYVGDYGEKASAFVGIENYTQQFNRPDSPTMMRPRKVVAEFAIVKPSDSTTWVGFRDVVEVDGQKVSDRRDRLQQIVTSSTGTASEAARLTAESARYNVGPITRNFNVPTTTMFFFEPRNIKRFTFTKKGKKKIDGVETWELEFKETQKPTMIVTRDGRDVPCEGSVWVVPADGTIVQTRLRLRGFSDQNTMTPQGSSAPNRPTANPNAPTGGREALAISGAGQSIDTNLMESEASIEVTYKKDPKFNVWLPSKMAEFYEGPIKYMTQPPFLGRATTRATYSDYKQFDTAATFKIK